MANSQGINLLKLQGEQEKALLECNAKLSQWKKFHNDYLILLKSLETIPDKISHDVMVPFGSVAFMPGKLIHTNEIMVLLGDNWFVDRSAKQASDIVRRRMEKCEKTIQSLEQEALQFQNWKQYTTSMKDEAEKFIEIVEDYDEESEKSWREKHKLNMKHHREKINASTTAVSTDAVEDEFWRKLDDLELEEFEAMQLERSNAISGQAHSISVHDGMDKQFEKNDTWQGDLSPEQRIPSAGDAHPVNSVKRTGVSSEKKVVWKDEAVQPTSKTGHVVKVNFSEAPRNGGQDSKPVDLVPASNLIRCPADIYSLFGTGQRSKSILKKSPSPVVDISPEPIASEPLPEQVPPETTAAQQIEAVATVVMERAPHQSTAPSTATAPRRVSKFKSQRQANS